MFTSPFLAIQTSFWPLLVSMILFAVMGNTVLWINLKTTLTSVVFPLVFLVALAFMWWKDVMRESLLGYHTHKLEVSLRIGMLLFILSEVFFFVSFFWAFYDATLSPTVEIGLTWPPKGISPLSVYSVPLLNTVILLTSGITVTWAHHSIMNNYFNKSMISLIVTVLLGGYFMAMQYVEYCEASFAISDGIYGTTFFMATGFHGFHVTIGTLFLLYVALAVSRGQVTYSHHFCFEAAAWYWHFVDVVWLFLFINIYWWGSL